MIIDKVAIFKESGTLYGWSMNYCCFSINDIPDSICAPLPGWFHLVAISQRIEISKFKQFNWQSCCSQQIKSLEELEITLIDINANVK